MLTLTLLLLLVPQSPTPHLALDTGPRFVDFSQELERPQVTVCLGTLGDLKEGKRERLPDAVLGNSRAQVSVSGTQYFKVPAQAPIEVQTLLAGKAVSGKPRLEFELQLARLPDGKEQRQTLTADGTPLQQGMLALWVLEPAPKKKGLSLLHVIAFDDKQFQGGDAKESFADTMRDLVTVNLRVRDLRTAIAAVDAAQTPAEAGKARAALAEVLAKQPELKRPADDALLQQQAGPWQQRAEKRLATEAAK
jgi:hypothetical protein